MIGGLGRVVRDLWWYGVLSFAWMELANQMVDFVLLRKSLSLGLRCSDDAIASLKLVFRVRHPWQK
jgi:hypothetical protein